MITQGSQGTAVTLPAATPTELLGASGFDMRQGSRFACRIGNTGANPVTAVALYVALNPERTRWTQDTTISGTIAAGSSMLIERDADAFGIRIVATSAVGSSVIVDAVAAA